MEVWQSGLLHLFAKQARGYVPPKVRLLLSPLRKSKPKVGDGTGFETRRGLINPCEFDPHLFRLMCVILSFYEKRYIES